MNRWLMTAGVAALMSLSTTGLMAQNDGGGGGRGGRNFDPAEMQQRILDATKENLEITNADEWAVLQPLVQKVMDARMATMAYSRGGFGMMFGRRGGRGGDNGGDNGGARRGPFGQAPAPEADTLNRAIESKASKADTKAALEKFVAGRKAKQAALEQAQENLRKVLTSRQEAIATYYGLL